MVCFLGRDALIVGAPMRRTTTLGTLFKGTFITVGPIVAGAALGPGLDGIVAVTSATLRFRGLSVPGRV